MVWAVDVARYSSVQIPNTKGGSECVCEPPLTGLQPSPCTPAASPWLSVTPLSTLGMHCLTVPSECSLLRPLLGFWVLLDLLKMVSFDYKMTSS